VAVTSAKMQIIYTLLQRDNHTRTLSLNFYRLDALPAGQRTVSKHWRQFRTNVLMCALLFHTGIHLWTPHGWLRSTVVKRQTLASELSLSCARPAADGWPLLWANCLLQFSQTGQLMGSINEQ